MRQIPIINIKQRMRYEGEKKWSSTIEIYQKFIYIKT